jgi:hypothetical protein
MNSVFRRVNSAYGSAVSVAGGRVGSRRSGTFLRVEDLTVY